MAGRLGCRLAPADRGAGAVRTAAPDGRGAGPTPGSGAWGGMRFPGKERVHNSTSGFTDAKQIRRGQPIAKGPAAQECCSGTHF